jgi:8-oxo-dGTP pyrophosphatase MutT (NUDIX family)
VQLDRLIEHPGRDLSARPPGTARAAVAAILREREGEAEVLLMQRAQREGDRWSGHVSFPGGRADERDPDLVATAVRETREEVGLDLERDARLIGRLDEVQAIAAGAPQALSITPFVFVQERPGSIVLSAEATASFWLPLDLARGGTLDSTFDYRHAGVPLALPCWRYQEYVVWGMTYRMLGELIERIG